MGKRRFLILTLGVIGFLAGVAPAGNWVTITTPQPLGGYPTMTMIDGLVPVVSNFHQIYEWLPGGWRQLGWCSGYIGGNGKSELVTNDQIVKYGADGRFYSTLYPNALQRTASGQWQVIGGDFPGPNFDCLCAADPSGWVYMAGGNVLGMTRGTDWTIYTLPLTVWDLAVSAYGDIAVAGYSSGNTSSVSWFDYKAGVWQTRSFGLAPSARCVMIAFDSKGNLGAAYVNDRYELWYSYLDLSQDYWTDEWVAENIMGPYYVTALAFDRSDQPVVAAGQVLAYNLQPTLAGMVVLGDYPADSYWVPVTVRLCPLDPLLPSWTYTSLVHLDGGFYVPMEVPPGTYDVAVKASHWLRKVKPGVTVGAGFVDVGTFDLINGDCDGDNAVTVLDLAIVLDSMDLGIGDPGYDGRADLDGDGEITSGDLSIAMVNQDLEGENLATTTSDLERVLACMDLSSGDPGFDPLADWDCDGTVTSSDLSIVLANLQ